MKAFLVDLKLHLVMVVLVGCLYPMVILGFGYFAGNAAKGFPIKSNNKIIGYENIGQQFSSPGYFWGRPSAVDYNAAGTGGSNKSTTNPDYLSAVAQRKVDFLKANPAANGKAIPSDLVTASGAGLDPHLSVQSALLQVERVAEARKLSSVVVKELIRQHSEKPPFGFVGVEMVNVLKLNMALDNLGNH